MGESVRANHPGVPAARTGTGGDLHNRDRRALLTAATGLLVAWYVVRFFNSRNERKRSVAMRILARVMTVVFFLYTDTYAAASDAAHHDEAFKLLLPNLTCVLSVLLFVFRYQPLPD